MKIKLAILILLSLGVNTLLPAGIDEQSKEALKAEQQKMFECFANGDVEVFKQITGDDYITINVDGTYMNKAEAAVIVATFQGSTNEILQQETRYYENIAITTGHAKFFYKSILVAEIFFTQTWVLRDGKWLFIGWQGTMTGAPQKYPIYFTVFATLVAVVLFMLILRFIKRVKKTV